MDKATAMVLTQSKPLWVGVILTLFFGGFAVFYVSILGGIVMGLFEIVFTAVTFMTLGIGLVFLLPLHLIALLWVILGVKRHNNRLLANLTDDRPMSGVPAEALQ